MVNPPRLLFAFCRLLAVVLLAGNALSSESVTFHFEGVPGQVEAGKPFPVTVQALDEKGIPDTNHTGEVALRGQVVNAPPGLIFSEIDFTNAVIELLNPGPMPIDISGWELRLNSYEQDSTFAVIMHLDFPSGTVVPGEGTVLVATNQLANVTAPVFVAKFREWNSIQHAHALVVRTRAGEVVDQVTVLRYHSSGAPTPRGGSGFGWRWHRVGSRSSLETPGWTLGEPGYGNPHPDLELPWREEVVNQVLYPVSIRLTNGVWSGAVTIPTPQEAVLLRAFGEAGESGSSEPMRVRHRITGMSDTGEEAKLFLLLDDSPLVEDAGFQTGLSRVYLSRNAPEDTIVTLQSDPPLGVPAQVVIPKGELSARFVVHLGNDDFYQGTNELRLRAEAEGWLPAEIRQTIYDNDASEFEVIRPLELVENESTPVEVRFAAPRPYDLAITVITLSGELVLPGEVVLPAGETAVSFGLGVPNNDAVDLARTASFRVSTVEEKFQDFTVSIADDEVRVFQMLISPAGGAQLAGRAIPLTARLAGMGGVVQRTNTTGILRVLDAGGITSYPPREIQFTNGIWSGEVVVAEPAGAVHVEVESGGFSATTEIFDVLAGSELSIVPLAAVWDEHTKAFLVSEGPAESEAGRLLAVDPATGEVLRSVALPKPGLRLAVSDDGTTAWLVSATGTLQRVDRATWEGAEEFPADSANPAQMAKELVLVPGSGERLVALVGPAGSTSAPDHWLVLYENGVPLVNDAPLPGPVSGAHLLRGAHESEVILATDEFIVRYLTSGEGIKLAGWVAGPKASWANFNFEAAGGKLFHGGGLVYDLGSLEMEPRLTDWPQSDSFVVPVPELGRAFYLRESQWRAMDITSRNVVGEFSYEALLQDNPARDFLAWPGDGFAFLSENNLLFLQTPLLSDQTADLSVKFLGPATLTNKPFPWIVEFDWVFEVTNHSSNAAPLAFLAFLDHSVPLGTLQPGEVRRVVYGISMQGLAAAQVRIFSSLNDPVPTNNSVIASTTVRPENSSNMLTLPVMCLTVSPDRNTLYGGLSWISGTPGIAVINPAERAVERVLPLAEEPVKIEVSSDNRFLFSLLGTNRLQRWDLAVNTTADPLTLTNERILDIAAVPEEPEALAVVTTRRLFVLDGSGIRPLQEYRRRLSAGVGFASDRLWVAEPDALVSFALNDNGVEEPSEKIPFTANGWNCDFVTNGRYLYFRTGAFDTETGETDVSYDGQWPIFAAPDLPWLYTMQGMVGGFIHRRDLWPPVERAGEVMLPLGQVTGMVPWGDGGLAVSIHEWGVTAWQLLIFESPIVPAPGTADVGVMIEPPADLYEDDLAEWRIVVTNHSSADALRVKLTLDVPGGLMEAEFEGPNASPLYGFRFFTAEGFVERLPAHSTVEYRFRQRVRIEPAVVRAKVTSATADPEPTNNSGESSVIPTLLQADLGIAIMESPPAATVGEEFEVSFVLTNAGPHETKAIAVRLRQEGFQVVSVDTGTVNDYYGDYWIPLEGPLRPGLSRTVTATLKPLHSGLLRVGASVSGDVWNENFANNYDSVLVEARPADPNGSIHLPTKLLTWVPARNEIVGATTDGTGLVFGLDPADLRLRWQVETEETAQFLSATSEGGFLWVASESGQAMRVNLETRQVDAPFRLFEQTGLVRSMTAAPGETNVLLAVIDPGGAGQPRLQAFRDGAGLPETIPGAKWVFTTPEGRIFVSGWNLLREVELLAEGLAEVSNYDHLAPDYPYEAFGMGNTIYFANGKIVDLEGGTAETLAWGGYSAVNAERNEIYRDYSVQVWDERWVLEAFDLATLEPKWIYEVPGEWRAEKLVPMGTNGLLAVGHSVRVIRPALFEPGVDLAVTVEGATFVQGTNIPVYLEVNVRNAASLAAQDTYLQVTVPPGLELLDFPEGRVPLGTFFRETNMTVVVVGTAPGEHKLQIAAGAGLPDLNAMNNIWEQPLVVAPRPVLFMNHVRVAEGRSIAFRLSAPAAHESKVSYWLEPLTADLSDIYVTNGIMTFQSGSDRSGFTLTTDDRFPESDEVIRVHLRSDDVDVLRDWIDVTVADDDTLYLVHFRFNVDEGNSGTNTYWLNVSLQGTSLAPTQLLAPTDVIYEMLGGTATVGVDFLPTTGILRFGPNEQEKKIPIAIVGDATFEPDETFHVHTRPVAGTMVRADRSSEIVIRNDDTPPAVALGIWKGQEGEGAQVWFETISGLSYELQYRTNLVDGAWVPADVDLITNGGVAGGAVPPGFYRVVARESE